MKKIVLFVLLMLLGTVCLTGCPDKKENIRIGYKNTTEQALVANMFKTLISKETSYDTTMIHYGSSQLAFEALEKNEIDLYLDYTGILNNQLIGSEQTPPTDTDDMDQLVGQIKNKHDIVMLKSIGYNNEYVLVMDKKQAEELSINKISQLKDKAKELIIAANNEFIDSPNGYKGLKEAYELEFKEVQGSEDGLRFLRLEEKETDIVQGYVTDSQILSMKLVTLEDDKDYFVDNFAVPLLSNSIVDRCPDVAESIKKLEGAITKDEIQKLAIAVDDDKKPIQEVVEKFLKDKQIIQ